MAWTVSDVQGMEYICRREVSVTRGSTAAVQQVRDAKDAKVVTLSSITTDDDERMQTGILELDRVLGGGIVPGSLVLVGGDPGIGKSTLSSSGMSEVIRTKP